MAQMFCIFLGVVFAIVAFQLGRDCLPADREAAEKLGFANGWIAYSIDSSAVRRFHDDLERKRDERELWTKPAWEATQWLVWEDCLKEARRLESEWNSMTDEQKLGYGCEPFWKRNVGEPRHLLTPALYEIPATEAEPAP